MTDLPSIVSGKNIVMFDPHLEWLPGATARQPGLKIVFSDEAGAPNALQTFPDQFRPYLFWGCSLTGWFPGTMFRFPLRSETVAKRSQIKRDSTSVRDVRAQLEQFRAQANHTLLFLKNVTKISVLVHDENATQTLFTSELADPEARRKGVWGAVDQFWRGGKKDAPSSDAFHHRLSVSNPATLPRGCNRLVVRQTTPGSAPVDEEYLVYEQLSGGPKVTALVQRGAALGWKMLPWGGVAALVKRNGEAATTEGGRAFCSLPLPVVTGFPFHVRALIAAHVVRQL